MLFGPFGLVLREFSNFKGILWKNLPLGGIFSPHRSSGGISFEQVAPRHYKDFLLKYNTPMDRTEERGESGALTGCTGCSVASAGSNIECPV